MKKKMKNILQCVHFRNKSNGGFIFKILSIVMKWFFAHVCSKKAILGFFRAITRGKCNKIDIFYVLMSSL